MHAKQRNEAIRHVVAYVFTIAMVFLAVTPFIYVVLTALKTKEQIYDPSQIIPTHITFDNFRQVLFQSNFVRYFMNSIFITLVTTLICMILSVMAAYGLTRYRIVGAGKIKMAVLMTRMFPGILLCIPYYIIMKQLNLIDSYIGLILMYCSFTLPFAIWNTCAFFISIPWELEEAARIDGCSRLKSFFHVIIHVAKPGLFVTVNCMQNISQCFQCFLRVFIPPCTVLSFFYGHDPYGINRVKDKMRGNLRHEHLIMGFFF